MDFYLNDLRGKRHFHWFFILLRTNMLLKFILSRTLFIWFEYGLLTTSSFEIVELQHIINGTTASNSKKGVQFLSVVKMPATTKLSMWALKYRGTLLSEDVGRVSDALMGLDEDIVKTVIFWG